MDDARFLIWEKQRGIHGLTTRGTSHNINTDTPATSRSSYDASWEERAFAEDAAGPLGGCIWPPRSYFCNFCGREFRSAQALGGHMNVHRRDRARLKQSLSPQDAFNQHQPSKQLQHGSQIQKPFVALHVPSEVCDMAYIPSPNSASFDIPAATSLSLKISSPSANGFYISTDKVPTYVPKDQEEPKQQWSKSKAADPNIHISDRLKMEAEKRGPQIYLGDRGSLMHRDKPDISVSLNLFLFQTQDRKRSTSKSVEDDYQGNDHCKKRKLTTANTTMSHSYTKSSIVDRLDVQEKLIQAQRSSNFKHELDLELRLGELPRVK